MQSKASAQPASAKEATRHGGSPLISRREKEAGRSNSADEDSGGAVYEDRPLAFDEYERAARRVLRLLRSNRRRRVGPPG
jgi:hypothetical protein